MNSRTFGLTNRAIALFMAALVGLAVLATVPASAAAPAQLSVSNAAIVEGNDGTRMLRFNVTLSKAVAHLVEVDFRTFDGSARTGSDYRRKSGFFRFEPGRTKNGTNIIILGDRTPEPDETFEIRLSNPRGASIADGTGTGRILDDDGGNPGDPGDDDPPPSLSMTDGTIVEGDNGSQLLRFDLSLTPASDKRVTVHFETEDVTTQVGNDYRRMRGGFVFEPGQTSKFTRVRIWGDTNPEPDEVFHIRLSDPVNAAIADDIAVGTILDDDGYIPQADLSIAKSDNVDPVLSGDTVIYTIDVANAGPDAAKNVVVTDTLPSGVTLVATNGCTEDPNGVPTCSLGDINPGDSASYTVEATVDNDTIGTITNRASVSSDTLDPNNANNTTSEDTTVNARRADLSITKIDDVDPVLAGDTLTYTLDVANAGPQTATNVVVTDTLPAGVTFVATNGCTEDPNAVPTCSLGDIAAGDSASYTVEVTVDNDTIGTITNRADVTSDTFDPNNADNTTSEETTVNARRADLSITKVDDVDPVLAGDTLTYTIEVANAGPQTATNVVVTDTLPAGVTFVATNGCTEDPNAVPTCSLGDINPGDSASYTVEVTVDNDTIGTITNRADVTSDTFDPNNANNTTSEDTTVNARRADLSITKVDDVDPVLAGDTLTYTIEVANAGPQTATNVVVTDTLPAGVTFVATNGCTEDPNGVPTCSLGDINPGDSASYTVEVTVDNNTTGTITNQASVTSDVTDPDSSDNSTTEDTTISAAGTPPTANDDGPTGTSAPGDDFHAPLNTTLTVANGSSEDLDANDDLGSPSAAVSHFGGGSLGGSVFDHAAGDTATFGAGSLTVSPNGALTFTPDTDFTGLFTFDYRLTNSGGVDDATVTIAVGNRPNAVDDSRDSLGNVGLDTGLAPVFSVFSNDGGDLLTITAYDATGDQGGTVNFAPDGTFIYVPAPGFEGTETFGYTADNGFGAPSDGTVEISVSDVIWFIHGGAVGSDLGTLWDPFLTTGAFNSSPLVSPGDRVFIREFGSAYNEGIFLNNSTFVLGDGATGTLPSNFGITTPPNSLTLPVPTGTDPVITSSGDGITLASHNTIRGLAIGDTDHFRHGIASSQPIGTLTVDQTSVFGEGGIIQLTHPGDFDVTFDSVESTRSEIGIDVNGATGSFTVSNPGVGVDTTIANAAQGISIQNSGSSTFSFGETLITSTTHGIDLDTNPGATFTFDNLDVTTSGDDGLTALDSGTLIISGSSSTLNSSGGGIDIDGTTGTLTFASVTTSATTGIILQDIPGDASFNFGTVDINTRLGHGIDIDGASGTFTFGATDIDNPLFVGGNGIDIRDSTGTFTFASTTITNASIVSGGGYDPVRGVPNSDGDGNGIFLKGVSGSFTSNGGTISTSADNGIDIRSSRDIVLDGVTIDQNHQGNSGILVHDVFNLTVDNSIIREIDDNNVVPPVTDAGIRATELDGLFQMDNTEIVDSEGYVFGNSSTGSANRAIELDSRSLGAPASAGCLAEDATGICDLDVDVTNSTISNWDFQGLNLRHIGGSLDVRVEDTGFSNINGAAISTGPSGQSAGPNSHGLLVGGAGNANTFTNVGIAVEVFSARGTGVGTQAQILNNTITNTISDAIRLNGFGSGTGGFPAIFRATVDGNTINGVADVAPSSGGGNAFFVAAEDGADVDVTIRNNNATGGPNGGTNAQLGITTQNQRAGDLDLVLTNNTFSNFPGAVNGFALGFFGHDDNPATATAVRFGGNNWNNIKGGFGDTLSFDAMSGTMDVEGYGGPPADSAALLAYLQSVDIGVASDFGFTIFSGSVTGNPATVNSPTYPTTP